VDIIPKNGSNILELVSNYHQSMKNIWSSWWQCSSSTRRSYSILFM